MASVDFEIIHASHEIMYRASCPLIVLQASFEFMDSPHTKFHALESYRYTITLSTDMQYLIDLVKFQHPFRAFYPTFYEMSYKGNWIAVDLHHTSISMDLAKIFTSDKSIVLDDNLGLIGSYIAADYPTKSAYIKDSGVLDVRKRNFYEYVYDKVAKIHSTSIKRDTEISKLVDTRSVSDTAFLIEARNINNNPLYTPFNCLIQLEKMLDYDESTSKLNIEDCFTWSEDIPKSKYDTTPVGTKVGFGLELKFPDCINMISLEGFGPERFDPEVARRYSNWNTFNLCKFWAEDSGDGKLRFLLQNLSSKDHCRRNAGNVELSERKGLINKYQPHFQYEKSLL